MTEYKWLENHISKKSHSININIYISFKINYIPYKNKLLKLLNIPQWFKVFVIKKYEKKKLFNRYQY